MIRSGLSSDISRPAPSAAASAARAASDRSPDDCAERAPRAPSRTARRTGPGSGAGPRPRPASGRSVRRGEPAARYEPLRGESAPVAAPQTLIALARTGYGIAVVPSANFPDVKKSDRRPPIDVASAKRIFDRQCKKTFATQSASSGPSALQQTQPSASVTERPKPLLLPADYIRLNSA
jgi:hypothetical protein